MGGGGPAEAVPSTTGCVLLTLRSQMPSRCPTYSLTSWQVALDVVALKLDTICQQKNGRHKRTLTRFPHAVPAPEIIPAPGSLIPNRGIPNQEVLERVQCLRPRKDDLWSENIHVGTLVLEGGSGGGLGGGSRSQELLVGGRSSRTRKLWVSPGFKDVLADQHRC